MEEDKDNNDSFPDLFGDENSEQKDQNSNGEDQIMLDINTLSNKKERKESQIQPKQTKPNININIADHEVEPKIEITVEKIADDIISLTQKLHKIADSLNTRQVLHQQVESAHVSKNIDAEEFRNILAELL